MTLGQLLRERRIELGKSLEQISAATRIHSRILSALEEDRYSELPARTFTRGFITSYCKALRLDPDQIFKDHHDFLEQKFSERQDRDQGHHGYVFEGKELEQNRRGMWIGAGIALFFAMAVLLVFKPQNRKHKEKHQEFTSEDVAAQTPPVDADTDEITTTGIEPTPASSPAASVASAAASTAPSPAATTASTTASNSPTPTAVAATSPALSATPAPSKAPAVAVQASATPASTPAVAAASPSASPAEAKKDPLNKGDDLEAKEVKKKIAFEAMDDVTVRYSIDDRKEMQFVLRKGRFLVIKAKAKISFNASKPEALRYRTKTREYFILDKSQFTVGDDGSLQNP